MFQRPCILVSLTACLGTAITLSACGQKGDLYLPTAPAGAQRATLVESLGPQGRAPQPAASAPAGARP